ncbi:MAG TPA: hypothetical protein VHW66_08810 [Stellaceae bacterium]|jgi:hypothetical protein|nr:hypothetical protein [Stellaceae bacterium]
MVLNLRAITAAAIVAGLAFAPMAQARDWHGGGRDWHGRGDYHRGGRGNVGGAVAAGIIGLGIGAAIASGGGPYYGAPSYYAPPPAVYYGY